MFFSPGSLAPNPKICSQLSSLTCKKAFIFDLSRSAWLEKKLFKLVIISWLTGRSEGSFGQHLANATGTLKTGEKE